MSKHMEFYIQDDAASIQIGKNVYRRVSIPIDDFNAACDHYGFVKERTCHIVERQKDWQYDFGVKNYEFSCGHTIGWAHIYEPKYCPNCGAKVVN